MVNNAKTRQQTGMRVVAGTTFLPEHGEWIHMIGPVKLTLNNFSYKCTSTDTRNGYFRGFHTIAAAKAFANHRKHGRSILEHQRVEKLKIMQGKLKISLQDFAKLIDVSKRTLEAYYSGARVVPESILI